MASSTAACRAGEGRVLHEPVAHAIRKRGLSQIQLAHALDDLSEELKQLSVRLVKKLLADIGDVLLQVLRIAGIHVLLGGVLQRLLHKLPVELRQGVLNGILHHHVKRSLLTVQLLLAIILREGRLGSATTTCLPMCPQMSILSRLTTPT